MKAKGTDMAHDLYDKVIADEAKNGSVGVTRREFSIKLGAGVLISGFYLLGGGMLARAAVPEKPSGGQPERPQLKPDLDISTHDGLTRISRQEEGVSAAVYGVNQPGLEIIKRLDGKHTVEDISRAVAASTHITRTEAVDAKIAFFIAQLGMLGLLRSPFYSYIVESMETDAGA